MIRRSAGQWRTEQPRRMARQGLLRTGLWLALTWIGTPGPSPLAQAQGLDDVVVDSAPAVVNEVPVKAPFQMGVATRAVESRLFGNLQTASAARNRLETVAKLQIDEVDRCAHLSEVQKQKLGLAAQGAIKQFFGQVDEKRQAFQEILHDPRKMQQFYRELEPLQNRFPHGVFCEGSLFTKTLRQVLDERQLATIVALRLKRTTLLQQVLISKVLGSLDSLVGLDRDQYRRLERLIVEETFPPQANVGARFESAFVVCQIAHLPPDRIRPIFHELQWKQVDLYLGTCRNFEVMLLKEGIFPIGPRPERWVVSATAEPTAENSAKRN